MDTPLDKLTIRGFKSIRVLEDFKLKNLNVIIGANGAGKSNFVDFFRLLIVILRGDLNTYIREHGGIDDFLYNGRKITEVMEFSMRFGERGYRFAIKPDAASGALLINEARFYEHGTTGWWELGDSSDGKSRLAQEATGNGTNKEYSLPVFNTVLSWRIYHFHDTSRTAPMRHYEIVQDNKIFRYNASNIAPFLLRLKNGHQTEYSEIINAIRLVMPFFDDFLLDEIAFGEKIQVNLAWQQKGSDYPMQPYHLSDGSIRFICLATALLQPNPPATIIIDEPELGLHPEAIALLAELIQSAALRTQVIVATQSPALIDYFAIEDIVVVNRKDGASTFDRLKEKDFSEWLKDYSVGELWRKNVIAGGTVHE